MTTPEQDAATHSSIEYLVVTAFRTARDRGKPDWRRMTVAVLKNRLLQLSRGAFHERHHGASSFRELLSHYPHLIRVEGDTVELVDTETTAGTESETTASQRIRADLWQAIMDFSSGKKYAWDTSQGRAREALPSDLLILPTLSADELGKWREEFVTAHGARPMLRQWSDKALGTNALPQDLRGPWNGFVRDKVVERLHHWFSSQKIQAPSLIQAVASAVNHEPSVEQLRRLIAACVAVMTEAELSEVRLPPSAVLRARLAGRLS